MKTSTRLWIGLAILAVLTPIGLLLPELMGAGGAWGEWGTDELEKMLGYLPDGLKKRADTWRAPMPDYATPDGAAGEHGMGRLSLEYIISAVIGIALCAGVVFLLMKLLVKRERHDS